MVVSNISFAAKSEHMKDSKQANHVSDTSYVGVKGSVKARETFYDKSGSLKFEKAAPLKKLGI